MLLKSNKKVPVFALIFRIFGFIMGLSTFIIQVLTNIKVNDKYSVNHLWAFFTVHTNIFVTLLFLLLIILTIYNFIKDKKLTVAQVHPLIHLGCSFYTTITTITYWFGFAPGIGMNSEVLTLLNYLFLFLFTPLFIIIDSLLFVKHGQLDKKAAVKWLAYPIVYYTFISIFSTITKIPYYKYVIGSRVIDLMYPYPFLDPQVMGGWGVALSILIITSLFLALGMLFIKLDGKIQKRIEKRKIVEL